MNISPRDVVLINGEFFYVHATSTKKTLTGESVTISGVNINGVKDDGVPVEDGNIQPFMVNLPKQDAERLFDRDRQLIRLVTAGPSRGRARGIQQPHPQHSVAYPAAL